MKRFFFFGEHVVPLRKYINTYKEQLQRNVKLKIRIAALEDANEKLNRDYNRLLAQNRQLTPTRDKGGRFVSKKK